MEDFCREKLTEDLDVAIPLDTILKRYQGDLATLYKIYCEFLLNTESLKYEFENPEWVKLIFKHLLNVKNRSLRVLISRLEKEGLSKNASVDIIQYLNNYYLLIPRYPSPTFTGNKTLPDPLERYVSEESVR